MKNYVCTLCLMLSAIAVFGQSKDHRLSIAAGGGPQDYKGDLGNGFKINSDDVWRGAVVWQVGYYLNRSFDISLFGSVGDYGYCQPLSVANTPIDEDPSKIRPYIYLGTAFNKVVDRMQMDCVTPGNYSSINTGAGARYYITQRISIGYQLSLGYFTSDAVDRMVHGSNDMYMQNSLLLGIDLL